MRKEKVPEVCGDGFVHSSKDGYEVVIENSDGPFSSIAMVHLRGHQLKLGIPSERDGLLVGCAGLVVQDLEVH